MFYSVLGLFLLIATFVLGELAVRGIQLVGPTTFPFRQFDSELGVSLIPNVSGEHRKCYDGFVSINRHGMRDRERTLEKPPGIFRIGVFSDSLIEAVHVKQEETATYLLEEKLNREVCNNNCEVLNFSVGGYATLQNYLRYMRDGRPFDLDMVILVVTDNDLAVITEKPANGSEHGHDIGSKTGQLHVVGNLYPSPVLHISGEKRVIVYPEEPPYTRAYTYMFRHSSLLYFLYKAYNSFIRGPQVWAIHDVAPNWAKRRPNALFLDPENTVAQRGWEEIESVLDMFVTQSREEDKGFWLVHWGYDEGSNPWYKPLNADALPPSFDPFYASKWFSNYGTRNNVPVYNLGNDIAEYVRSNNLEAPYLSFSCDMHLNPAGQALVADLLLEQIIAAGMIP